MVPSCLTLQVPSWQMSVLLSHPFIAIDHLHHSDAFPSFFYSWSNTLILTLLMWLSYQAENFNCFSDMLITNQKLFILFMCSQITNGWTTPTTLSWRREITKQQYLERLQIHADFSWVFCTGILQPLQNMFCFLLYCPKQSPISEISNATISITCQWPWLCS